MYNKDLFDEEPKCYKHCSRLLHNLAAVIVMLEEEGYQFTYESLYNELELWGFIEKWGLVKPVWQKRHPLFFRYPGCGLIERATTMDGLRYPLPLILLSRDNIRFLIHRLDHRWVVIDQDSKV